ncbi:MAG: Fe2+-dependent dioxygenase [Steroidobacteraceae bacterium]
MLVSIPQVLGAQDLAAVNTRLAGATWEDGRQTAGYQSAQVKRNLQLSQSDAAARDAGDLVLRALERSALFVSATLPRRVYPPLFNRYEPGMSFDAHVDNAVRQIPGTPHRLRTDVSATLFLSPPADYDGGELIVEDTFGAHSVKLAAGDMVVYPASSLHRVQPVTRGARLAAFFWVQSVVRDDGGRTLLFELDTAVRQLTARDADRDSLVRLTACYHNLLRRWAEL